MSNSTVPQITPAPAGTLLATPDRGPGEPPEALVRIAAAVGGWSRKGARKRIRRVWPLVRADLDDLYRAHEEERRTGDRKREETWVLTQTGNWAERRLDLNGNGTLETSSGELDERGTFNAFNQLLERDTNADASPDATLLYDRNGNTTNDGTYKLVYDPFGRLRKVLDSSDDSVVAEYTYNGLGFQITRHVDLEPDGDVDGNDPLVHQVYDGRWRLRAVYTGADDEAKEQYVLHQAGVDGAGGSSYIDLVVCRDRDGDTNPEDPTDEVREERVYFCQNWRADMAAVLRSDWTSLPAVLEWAKFSTYGEPVCLPFPEMNYSGATNSTDISEWYTRWSPAVSTFDPRLDATFDGVVNSTDSTRFSSDWLLVQSTPWGRGVLSRVDTRNVYGFSGYTHDPVFGASHQRRRTYMGGRWLTPDPLGQVDGPSLYEYVKSSPIVNSDAMGLASCGTSCMQRALYDGPSDWSEAIREKKPVLPDCSAILTAALADPRVKAAVAAAAAACGTIPTPSIAFVECSDPNQDGEFICTWFGKDKINLCRAPGGGCPGVNAVIDTLVHELKHFEQSCRMPRAPGGSRCREWNLQSCTRRLAHEIEAYCTEPRNAADCAAAPKGDCLAAGRLCAQACGSLPAVCFEAKRCQNYCLKQYNCPPAAPPTGLPPLAPPAAPATPPSSPPNGQPPGGGGGGVALW